MTVDPMATFVCVLCGAPWVPGCKNLCECGGFCTWGPAKGAEPSSWDVDADGNWTPKPPPFLPRKEES